MVRALTCVAACLATGCLEYTTSHVENTGVRVITLTPPAGADPGVTATFHREGDAILAKLSPADHCIVNKTTQVAVREYSEQRPDVKANLWWLGGGMILVAVGVPLEMTGDGTTRDAKGDVHLDAQSTVGAGLIVSDPSYPSGRAGATKASRERCSSCAATRLAMCSSHALTPPDTRASSPSSVHAPR